MPVIEKPLWPSCSSSNAKPQPLRSVLVPTKSMFVTPAVCSCVHRYARQQPGAAVMESPSGMMRTGVCASAREAMPNASIASKAANARKVWLRDIETSLCMDRRYSLGRFRA